jgi:hypothetical protein
MVQIVDSKLIRVAANHEFTSSYDNSEEIKNAAPGLRKRIVDKIKRRKKSR